MNVLFPADPRVSFRTPRLEACQDACQRDRRCEAYTFNTRTETCYLKDEVGNLQANPDTITGQKGGAGHGPGNRPGELSEEWGQDYRGGDYDSFPVRSLASCQAECRNEGRCRAYSFNTRTKLCYLKDRVGSPEENRETVTGVKGEGQQGWP